MKTKYPKKGKKGIKKNKSKLKFRKTLIYNDDSSDDNSYHNDKKINLKQKKTNPTYQIKILKIIIILDQIIHPMMKKKFQILFKIMKNYIILIFLMMIRKKMKKK